MQKQLEQTLDSREVAEMVGKEHNKLLRDIRRYIGQLGEAKIGHTDFFRESTYQTEQNKEMPCYRITKKGCEFIAHKLTGTKGTAFTARYINRFHEMEHMLSEQQGQGELAELQEAVKKQGKLLESISRSLMAGRIAGAGSRTEQEMYRGAIIQIINTTDNREALCKIHTFAK